MFQIIVKKIRISARVTWRSIRRRFFRKLNHQPREVEPSHIEVIEQETIAAIKEEPVAARPKKSSVLEGVGAFYFKKTILNELDSYFKVLKRVRVVHQDAYDLYSRIGATIVPWTVAGSTGELPAWWKNGRPSFSCVWLGYDDSNDVPVKFMFMQKLSKPHPSIQVFDGEVYTVALYYDGKAWEKMSTDKSLQKNKNAWMKKSGFVVTYHIGVSADNVCHLLREFQVGTHLVKSKNKKSGKKTNFYAEIPYRIWDYPKFLKSMFKCRTEKADMQEFKTIEGYSVSLFTWLANIDHGGNAGIRVQCSKETESAMFCIDMKRTAYFFKDRIKIQNENGNTSRIFHVVRPHNRTYAGGSEKAIKMHFRGLRDFIWNGYKVCVTMPGLHHDLITDFTVGLIDTDSDQHKASEDDLPIAAIGDAFKRHIVDGKQIAFEET